MREGGGRGKYEAFCSMPNQSQADKRKQLNQEMKENKIVIDLVTVSGCDGEDAGTPRTGGSELAPRELSSSYAVSEHGDWPALRLR